MLVFVFANFSAIKGHAIRIFRTILNKFWFDSFVPIYQSQMIDLPESFYNIKGIKKQCFIKIKNDFFNFLKITKVASLKAL